MAECDCRDSSTLHHSHLMTPTPMLLFISTHLEFFTFGHKLIGYVDQSAELLSQQFLPRNPLQEASCDLVLSNWLAE